jgi:hypothetical protein
LQAVIAAPDRTDPDNALESQDRSAHLSGVEDEHDRLERRLTMKTILAGFLALGMALTGVAATASAHTTFAPHRVTVTGNEAG